MNFNRLVYSKILSKCFEYYRGEGKPRAKKRKRNGTTETMQVRCDFFKLDAAPIYSCKQKICCNLNF